jgi:hypothetical protein
MSSAGAPLAALAGGALERRFQFWQGASGRRYICSIFPLSVPGATETLPYYTQAVAVAVVLHGGARRIAFVADIGEEPDRLWATLQNVHNIAEYHIHLLADTAMQRQTVCADLSAHHGCPWRRVRATQCVSSPC